VEQEKASSSKLAAAVARYYHKLLAYKDEYEVARLHANGEFRKKIESMFEGNYKTFFYLAPPLLAKTDPVTGEPRKMRFGSWMSGVFKILHRMKFLRGTPLDPFGHTEERRTERALIREYEGTVERLLGRLTPQNHALAVQIATVPDEIRGFGPIKARNLAPARKKRDELLARYEAGPSVERVAA
jgi:indolepyruvate ferredoxin oxidoreductase